MPSLFLMLILFVIPLFSDQNQTLTIIQKPIVFKQKRINLTKQYMKQHYGIEQNDITITPKMVVIHWTGTNSFKASYGAMYHQKIGHNRTMINKASQLNISAHFLVDRDGTIYQLMPDNWMARHVIGLNYWAIGIENVGGSHKKQNLTQAQLRSNIALIHYLQKKYPTIKYIIGHYQYKNFEKSPLWLEKNPHYRTDKYDPGAEFMKKINTALHSN